MFWIISYDISDDKARRRVAKILEDTALRIQKSVFEVEMVPEEFRWLRRKLQRYLKDDTDSIFYHPLCGECCTKRIRDPALPQTGEKPAVPPKRKKYNC